MEAAALVAVVEGLEQEIGIEFVQMLVDERESVMEYLFHVEMALRWDYWLTLMLNLGPGQMPIREQMIVVVAAVVAVALVETVDEGNSMLVEGSLAHNCRYVDRPKFAYNHNPSVAVELVKSRALERRHE